MARTRIFTDSKGRSRLTVVIDGCFDCPFKAYKRWKSIEKEPLFVCALTRTDIDMHKTVYASHLKADCPLPFEAEFKEFVWRIEPDEYAIKWMH